MIRALVAYGIVAFAVLQIIEPVMHGLHWPDAVLSAVIIALAAIGPVVVGIAWAFDVDDAGHRSRVGLALVFVVLLVAAVFLAMSLQEVHAALGSIEFRGLPQDATIQVDGEVSPADKPVHLREGSHEFQILAPGYESRSGTVRMNKNLALVYDISLKPLPGRLTLFSDEAVTCTLTPVGGAPRTEAISAERLRSRSTTRPERRGSSV